MSLPRWRLSLLLQALGVSLPIAGWTGCADVTKSPPLPVASCSSAWSTPFGNRFEDYQVHESLGYADGKLIFTALDENGGQKLVAQPTDGSPRTTLVTHGHAKAMWQEGDQLLYSTGDEFFRVPLTGGTPETVFVAGTDIWEQAPTLANYAGFSLATSSTLFFAESTVSPLESEDATVVFAVDRATQAVRVVGQFQGVAREGGLFGDKLVIDAHRAAYLLPVGGGEAQLVPFDPNTQVRGMDGQGVYVDRLGDAVREIFVVSLDGSKPRVFWRNEGPGFATWRIWPLSDGSHVVAGVQDLDDGKSHQVIWRLQAGTAQLLACSPRDDEADPSPLAFVEAEDALYFGGLFKGGPTIVRVPR